MFDTFVPRSATVSQKGSVRRRDNLLQVSAKILSKKARVVHKRHFQDQQGKDVQFKIKSIDPENMQVTLDPPQGQGTQVIRHALRVEIPAAAPSINRLGTDVAPYGAIVLETTHPDVPELTIKVRFAIE